MQSYADSTSPWELPHTSSFTQLVDDDFLAALQKQFQTTHPPTTFTDGVNPQNISRYSLPSITPPSEDSSPSPPNFHSDLAGSEDGGDPALKRKASDEDFGEGPSQKSQHTLINKKSTSRRKSTSGVPKDETRLLKRKEQNRAAQRAFRERKEKHVKDLEDKVAALEARNEQAVHENENLRDLLTRLQNENLALRQTSFTFSVPKSGGVSPQNAPDTSSFASQSPEFASPSTSSSRSPPSQSNTTSKVPNPLEWSSLTTFDPAMLNLLDDSPQPTATDGARQMDFGFGSGLTSNTTYTTIASNPMFMSYSASFDTATPQRANNDANNSYYHLNGVTWSPQQHQDSSPLDDLLAGYMSRGPEYPYTTGTSLSSESPVNHHPSFHHNISTAAVSHSTSSLSSPSSSTSDPLFEAHRDSSASDSDVGHEIHEGCPKTRAEIVQRIEASGPSPFAPAHPANVRKSESATGPMITCAGTSLPKTRESDQNIEVLSAWRSITSNPKFKDVDIDRLCTEFTSKAKCDGVKVVLEPQVVDSILQNLSKK